MKRRYSTRPYFLLPALVTSLIVGCQYHTEVAQIVKTDPTPRPITDGQVILIDDSAMAEAEVLDNPKLHLNALPKGTLISLQEVFLPALSSTNTQTEIGRYCGFVSSNVLYLCKTKPSDTNTILKLEVIKDIGTFKGLESALYQLRQAIPTFSDQWYATPGRPWSGKLPRNLKETVYALARRGEAGYVYDHHPMGYVPGLKCQKYPEGYLQGPDVPFIKVDGFKIRRVVATAKGGEVNLGGFWPTRMDPGCITIYQYLEDNKVAIFELYPGHFPRKMPKPLRKW